jgi:C1A family cysteine protease
MATVIQQPKKPTLVSGVASTNRTIQRYGWIPDLPDIRDLPFAAAADIVAKLPAKVDLRAQCPPVYDQGQLGSCTANAIAGAMQFDEDKTGKFAPVPSRLFIYFNERVIEGTVSSDSGAQIRDGIKSVAKQGAPPETDWPYVISKFANHPPSVAYQDGKETVALQYLSVPQVLTQLKGCLAAGFPVIFGFSVYESFESLQMANTGIGILPTPGEKCIGGHAVLCVGYDDTTSTFFIRNSWGSSWGMQGYFTFPYDYLTNANLSSDFWSLRKIGHD